MHVFKFPKGFLWGTASSAYQTEGNNKNCNWYWYFEEHADLKKPDFKRRLKEPCGTACDFWNRYQDDFDSAEAMGIQIHRLSIEWSRVFPTEDHIDKAALAHYKEMLQNLKSRNIKIMLCLHHFTFPQWISESGGLNYKAVLS